MSAYLDCTQSRFKCINWTSRRQGCMEGLDIEVIHSDGLIELRYQDLIECVNEDQWTRAVLGFAKQIRQFYQESTEKSYITDDFDRTGWDAFWQEWSDREAAAMASLGMG